MTLPLDLPTSINIEAYMQAVLIAVANLKLKDIHEVYIEEKSKCFLVQLIVSETHEILMSKLIKKSLIAEGVPNDILQRLKVFENA